jgi:hypothetical protein
MDGDKPTVRLLESVSENGRSEDELDDADDSLSAREIRFADALAAGTSVADAATAVGISQRSARRWRKKPEIAELVKTRLSENVSMARAILSAGTSKAALGLVAMAGGESTAESARVAACARVLDGALQLGTFEEFASRLAAIEAQQSAQSAEATSAARSVRAPRSTASAKPCGEHDHGRAEKFNHWDARHR